MKLFYNKCSPFQYFKILGGTVINRMSRTGGVVRSNLSISSFVNKVKIVIKSSNYIFDDKTMGRLAPDYTLPPGLYGLLKIHKSANFIEIPIRPVIAFTNSPVYSLVNWLNTFLKEIVKDTFTHTILNSYELIDFPYLVWIYQIL